MGQPLTLRARTTIVIAVALGALAILFAGVLYSERELMLSDRQEKVRHLVEVAHGAVADFEKAAKDGRMSVDDAKKAAIAAVRSMRYDRDEYFWINDMSQVIVMHAAKPELEGKSMAETRDPDGKFLFREMVAVVQKDGGGFVDYHWPKAGNDKPVPKLSYVKGFAPWGWVIGTGIYLDDVDEHFRNAAMKLLGGGLVIAVLLATPLVLLRRFVIRALGGEPAQAVEIARGIAAGDMTGRLTLAPGDQTSLLAAVDRMQGQLRTMIVEVSAEAERVAQQAREMLSSTDDFTHRFEAQSESTQSIAAAVEQMSVGIDEIARNTVKTHELAREAGGRATDGCRVIEATTLGINRLSDSVNASSERIRELERYSVEVSSVVGTIRDIADQTNLLALNAAIEAARAGEQGRGFAVVADEVRKLSERTSLSTAEIASTVNRIQEGIQHAVASMGEGVAQAAQGVGLSQQAGEAVAGIQGGAERVTLTLDEISGAIREQSMAGQSIAQSVEQIAQMTDRNVEEAKRLAAVAGGLLALSEALHKAMARFRV